MSESSKETGPSGKILEAVDILKVLELLPHRYPFLMVDRITQIDGLERGVGVKNVTFNEPHFQGHFPASPVMPGVLIIEGMAQTAGAMCVHHEFKEAPQLVYFMTIDKCKFRKPVVPGDCLEYHVELIRRRRDMFWYQGTGIVDGAKVAEAEIGAVIVHDPE